MIEVLENENNDILEVKVIEKLSSADFEHLKPVLDKHIKENSKPRLFLIMEEFSGWSDASAFWKDLKMDREYIGKFNQIALVGDARWEEWGTRLVDPVTSAELKFFALKEITHARKWLNQNN